MSNSPRLLTPGPLSIALDIKERMLTDLGSRDVEFRAITEEIRRYLLEIAGGTNNYAAVPLQGSGTFAIEAALMTFVGAADKVLVCVNGTYGARMAAMLRRHRRDCSVLSFPATVPVDVDQVEQALETDQSITHICFVHCETTTGIVNPYRALLASARQRGVVSVVDAMSSFGALDIDAARDEFDILVSSGNKCVEAPPGIAFAVVHNGLLKRKTTHATTYSLDLYDQWLNFEQTREWRTTPPTHVAQALHSALIALHAEGVSARHTRYSANCERLIAGMRRLDFEPVLDHEVQSPICVAFRSDRHVPNARVFDDLYNHLRAAGIVIYAKFHEETRSLRIGCIGQIEDVWIDDALAAVEDFAGRQNGRLRSHRSGGQAALQGAPS